LAAKKIEFFNRHLYLPSRSLQKGEINGGKGKKITQRQSASSDKRKEKIKDSFGQGEQRGGALEVQTKSSHRSWA